MTWLIYIPTDLQNISSSFNKGCNPIIVSVKQDTSSATISANTSGISVVTEMPRLNF